jgi:integrase
MNADMSQTAETVTLTLAELETMLREPVRDKRYLDTRLGPSVRAYLSWKENEAGAAERTLDQYERDLARMCVSLASHDVRAVTTDELREVRDSFPKGSRKRVTAAYRDFWRWLYQEGRIERDPMARVRYPKRESVPVLDIFSSEEEARLITSQTFIRDRVGLAILLDAGVRASEMRHLQVRDVDLTERWLIVRRGKGGKGRVVPIRGRVVRLLEEFFLTPIPKLDRQPALTDFVLYPTGGAIWADVERSNAMHGAVDVLAVVERVLEPGRSPLPQAAHFPAHVRDEAPTFVGRRRSGSEGAWPRFGSDDERRLHAPGR